MRDWGRDWEGDWGETLGEIQGQRDRRVAAETLGSYRDRETGETLGRDRETGIHWGETERLGYIGERQRERERERERERDWGEFEI